MQQLLTSLGGRKFLIALAGLFVVGYVARLPNVSGDAFLAIGAIVASFVGGNATVEWAHAKKAQP